jgi:hypothetical protein
LNKTKAAILIGIILLISSNLVMLANATSDGEGSLSSGYAVTNNYHGQNVPFGADVIVTAMSTNSQVDEVRFIWKDPAGQVVWDETINVFHNGTTYNGKLVYYAISTHKPGAIGDWGVQAKFYDEINYCWMDFDIRLATRATSFNVVPELPLIGTAGASVAMVLGLALFKAKRKPL